MSFAVVDVVVELVVVVAAVDLILTEMGMRITEARLRIVSMRMPPRNEPIHTYGNNQTPPLRTQTKKGPKRDPNPK